MNILVVHETEYIEKVIFEYQIIPELWASWGHNVYVVDFPTKLDKKSWYDVGLFKSRIIKNVRRANKKKGVTLIRPGIIKLPVISRISASISHYFAIKRAIKEYKIDVIFLYSVPTNGLQAVFLAKKFNIPIYFRLLDVLHLLVPNKILSLLTFLMEKSVYKRVDELTAITPKLTEYALRMGAKRESTSYLPSGSDNDLFFPKVKDKNLVEKYHLKKSDTVVMFAGTLYNFSGLDLVLEYFAKHRQKYPHLKFFILGHGEQSKALFEIIKKNKLHSSVFMTGFIDYRLLPQYLNLADICINPFAINPLTNLIFPGKIYQYLACGKPVVATKLAGLIDIFPDNGGKNGLFYYEQKNMSDFFGQLIAIGRREINSHELSLQQIARLIERQLKSLSAS